MIIDWFFKIFNKKNVNLACELGLDLSEEPLHVEPHVIELEDDSLDLVLPKTETLPFELADPTERSKELSKQAVKFKDSDLTKAIKLMEEAVSLKQSDEYLARLAYYYVLSGRKDLALQTHSRRLGMLNNRRPLEFLKIRSQIISDLRKTYSRFEDHKTAVICELESEYLLKVLEVLKANKAVELDEEQIFKGWVPLKSRTIKKELKIIEIPEELPRLRNDLELAIRKQLPILINLKQLISPDGTLSEDDSDIFDQIVGYNLTDLIY